jgi:trehalose-phosphatase
VTALKDVPLLWDREQEFHDRLTGKTVVIFLDYDGTLTPIVEDYMKAFLSDAMRRTIVRLADVYTVAVISGRDVDTIRHLVDIDTLMYAGSHGFEISGPKGMHDTLERGFEALPELDQAEAELNEAARDLAGHAIERKRFAVEIHYRRMAETDVPALESMVDEAAARHPRLRKGHGKKVFRLQPDIEWDKGHAMLWLLDRFGLNRPEVLPVYVGDDITDEDAFRELRGRGVSVVVRGEDDRRPTLAHYALADVGEVQRFLEMMTAIAPESTA